MKTDYIFDYNDGTLYLSYNDNKSLQYELYDENFEKLNYGVMIINKPETVIDIEKVLDLYDEKEDDEIVNSMMKFLRFDRHIYTDLMI